jgi:hypothetical protein
MRIVKGGPSCLARSGSAGCRFEAVSDTPNWQAPKRPHQPPGLVHHPSAHPTKDGTPATLCRARVTGRWTATAAEVTCRNCIGIGKRRELTFYAMKR